MSNGQPDNRVGRHVQVPIGLQYAPGKQDAGEDQAVGAIHRYRVSFKRRRLGAER